MQSDSNNSNSATEACVNLGYIEFHKVAAGAARVILQGNNVGIRFFQQRLLKPQQAKAHHGEYAVKKYGQRFLHGRKGSIDVDYSAEQCHMNSQEEPPLDVDTGGNGLSYIDQFIKRHGYIP